MDKLKVVAVSSKVDKELNLEIADSKEVVASNKVIVIKETETKEKE